MNYWPGYWNYDGLYPASKAAENSEIAFAYSLTERKGLRNPGKDNKIPKQVPSERLESFLQLFFLVESEVFILFEEAADVLDLNGTKKDVSVLCKICLLKDFVLILRRKKSINFGVR